MFQNLVCKSLDKEPLQLTFKHCLIQDRRLHGGGRPSNGPRHMGRGRGLEQVERKRNRSSLDSHVESLYTAGHLEALEGLEQREVIWSNCV